MLCDPSQTDLSLFYCWFKFPHTESHGIGPWAPQGVFQAMCHTHSPVWQSGRCFNCWKRTSGFGHQLCTAHLHWAPCTRRQLSHLPQWDSAFQDFTSKHLRSPRVKTRAYQDFILFGKPVINNYPNQFSNYYSQVFGRAVIFSLLPWGLLLKPSEHVWFLLFKNYSATSFLKLLLHSSCPGEERE